MNTKLTLSLRKEIIEQAKTYAAENNRSLSEIVENYFKFLISYKAEKPTKQLSGRIQRLRGVMKVDPDFDYKKILKEEKSKKHDV